MTPENLNAAATLLGEMQKREQFLETLRKDGFEALVIQPLKRVPGYPIRGAEASETAIQILEAHIERDRAELRKLGVVFEADDAVMPEIKEAPVSDCPNTPDHLTISITGPQGCGKTVIADFLRQCVAFWNGTASYDGRIPRKAREALTGKPITILDDGQPVE